MRKCGMTFVARGVRLCLFQGSAVGRSIRLIIAFASLLLMIRIIGLSRSIDCAGWQQTEENQGSNFMVWETLELESDGEDLSITPNRTWMKIREDLLRGGSPQQGVSKAVMFSYMRGGSTLFAHVFNIDPASTMLWYEALDGFHAHYSGCPVYTNTLRLHYNKNLTRRPTDKQKVLAMSDYLTELLTCDVDRLPIEVLTHRFIINSTGLAGLAQCMSAYIPLVYRTRQHPMAIVRNMEYGLEYETRPHLKIVSYINLARYFSRSDLEDVGRADPMDVFRRYFSQVEDGELKEAIRDSCGTLWALHSSEVSTGVVGSAVKFVVGDGLAQSEEESMEETIKDKDQQRSMESRMQSWSQCWEIRDAFMNFLNITLFMRSIDKDTRTCRDALKSACGNKELIVAEIHRASVLDLEPLIQRMPDIHVIYYVRDPRAIAVSRADPLTQQVYKRDPATWSVIDEAKLLCRKMWDDLRARRRLERRYPGSILTVRYEDFIRDPRGTVERMYGKLLRKVPEGFERWMSEMLNATESASDAQRYGIKRSNSIGHISNWRSKVNFFTGQAMTQHCLKVLRELDYEP